MGKKAEPKFISEPFQILLVEDDLSDIDLLKIQFDKINLNLETHVVRNQQEFEDYFKNHPLPDLVVSDYELPEYNGEQVLKYMRDRHDFLPFILVTGYLNEEDAVELMKSGASDIIIKQKLDRLGPAVQRELLNYRERMGAQREIEIAHNRFQSLVEQGGDVVAVLNNDGIPEYVSPSVKNVFGYTVEEAKLIDVETITHPEDFLRVEKAMKQAMKFPGKNIPVPPVRMKHKDGTWRWFKTSLTDLRHQPSVSGIVDNIRDIHEQILHARNNKLMLNNTEDSFVYINRDLIIQSFNDSFAKKHIDIFGMAVERGESILQYTQPERREIVKDIYDRVLQGETIEGELPLETKEGNTRYFQIKYKPATDESENIIGSFISLIEITDEKTAKSELEKNEARYRALVENGSDVLFILKPNGNPKYISPSIKKVLGYTAEEAMQIDMMENAHPDDTDMIMREIGKCLDQPGVPMKVPPARLKDKNGEWHWFEGTITNMLHDPAIEGIVDNFHEITERIEAEEKTKDANKKLRTAQNIAKLGYWEFNLESEALYWSDEVYRIWGIQKDKEVDLNYFIDSVHPDDRDEFVKDREQAIFGEIDHDYEHRIILDDGTMKWVHEKGGMKFDDNGNAVSFEGTVQDVTEQKIAALKLQQAYKEKETILESIDDGFFTLNRNWIVTYWNSKAEVLLHTPKEKILGRNLWALFQDAIDLPSYTNYHKVMEEGISINFEDYYEPIGRWFDINVYPSEDGISVYFKDITERKTNEEKIKRSNERFQKVTEATNDAIWDYDATTQDLFWGKGFETLFGYDLEKTEPSFEFLIGLIHPDDRDGIAQKIQTFMKDASKKDWFEEYRFKKANGKYAYVTDMAVFIRDDEDRVVRIVGAMTDLTQQVEEGKQLKLYESVVTNTQESIVITEANPTDLPGRKILYVNKAFTKMTGYNQEEMLGRTLTFLNGPKTAEDTLEKLRSAIENYEPVEVEFINYKKNGEEFWINTSMVPVTDNKGNYTHWVAIGRDVTSRRNYEEEIQTSLAEKETLLAEIHHRVKNNLAVISGMMQLQAFESDNKELQDKLFDSVSRIKTMATVHELLYHTNSFSDIDFSKTLEYLIRSVSKTLQRNANTEVNIESEPIKLNINQAIPISLIVNEVITNVYKHAFKDKKKGKIDIHFQETDGTMLLEIRDNGLGLPANFDKTDMSSMGLKLINVLSEQINAEYDFISLEEGTKFVINFERSNIRGAGNAYMN